MIKAKYDESDSWMTKEVTTPQTKHNDQSVDGVRTEPRLPHLEGALEKVLTTQELLGSI